MANIVTDFWHKAFSTQKNPTKQSRRIPRVDKTERLQVNKALTYGIFHNQYEDMKLAGALAYNPIMIPVYFMGIPSIMSENEVTQERLTRLIDDFSVTMSQMHLESHRDGTVWVFPYYDASNNKLEWEFIPDESVYKIIKNIDNNKISKIIVKESITMIDENGNEFSTTRKRIFTTTKVEETFEGSNISNNLKSNVKINTAGILPIPFSNNPDLNEVRGHSDLERIVHDLKAYHDIQKQELVMGSKFKPKMWLNIKETMSDWLDNNGWADISDIDLNTMDLIVTNNEADKAEFIFPNDLSNFYTASLKRLFRKVVESSGIPEIAWGLKTEGNNASVDESMSTLLYYVQAKQNQKSSKYVELFKASLRILSIAEMTIYTVDDIKCEWGKLDGLSQESRAKIFNNFTAAMSKIVDSATGTKKQLYKCWKMFYPEETEETFEDFEKGISLMGAHNAWKNASYVDISDREDYSEDE